jgi:hypothetical protein
MLERLFISIGVALSAFVAASGVASARPVEDEDVQLMVGTFLVALGGMAVLFVFYLIKRSLGGFKMPPPDEHDAGHH